MCIHEKAIQAAARFKLAESDLISIFQKPDETRAYLEKKHTSLFSYSVQVLGLSEDVTSNLITVSRKAKVIPALQAAIQNGEITVSKARKITPVISPENQVEWIMKAQTLSSRQIETEVAKLNPRSLVHERMRPVCEDRLELKIGISQALAEKLKRVQDLESQRTQSVATLEQTLEAMADIYLERNDPVIKAERILNKSVKHVTGRKAVAPKTVPSHVKYQVIQRDRGQCTHRTGDRRCESRRWLDVHHVHHRADGGDNSLENLITLCSAHHRMQHGESPKARH
jgi:5-methylcytosine-specific restriction endonuclease McrA